MVLLWKDSRVARMPTSQNRDLGTRLPSLLMVRVGVRFAYANNPSLAIGLRRMGHSASCADEVMAARRYASSTAMSTIWMRVAPSSFRGRFARRVNAHISKSRYGAPGSWVNYSNWMPHAIDHCDLIQLAGESSEDSTTTTPNRGYLRRAGKNLDIHP